MKLYKLLYRRQNYGSLHKNANMQSITNEHQKKKKNHTHPLEENKQPIYNEMHFVVFFPLQNIFHSTQYTQNTIISTCNQY